MEIYSIAFSKGSLGHNLGCEDAGKEISKLLNGHSVKEVPVFQDNIERTNESIFNSLKGVKKGIIIGGDHSISYSCFKGFAVNNPNAGLIVFDAHPDVVGNVNPPSHEDYLRTLIDSGIVDSSRIILVGVRSSSPEEGDYLTSKKITCFNMQKIMDLGINEVCDLVMEKSLQWGGIYLSVDIDVCDPSCAPGTGYIEPGGLSSRELLYFISRLKKMRNLGIIDIVEINPKKDINKMTVVLGVKIIGEVLNETLYSN